MKLNKLALISAAVLLGGSMAMSVPASASSKCSSNAKFEKVAKKSGLNKKAQKTLVKIMVKAAPISTVKYNAKKHTLVFRTKGPQVLPKVQKMGGISKVKAMAQFNTKKLAKAANKKITCHIFTAEGQQLA